MKPGELTTDGTPDRESSLVGEDGGAEREALNSFPEREGPVDDRPRVIECQESWREDARRVRGRCGDRLRSRIRHGVRMIRCHTEHDVARGIDPVGDARRWKTLP